MGKITGFMEIERQDRAYAPVAERVKFYKEFTALPDADVSQQGARCMDCGIPFCQTGCPVNNIIPDWNDLVYRGNWRALDVLHSTNNFPSSPARLPAPCELRARSTSTTTRWPSKVSRRRSSTRGRKAGSGRSSRRRPARRSPSSLQARRHGAARRSRASHQVALEKTAASAGCFATASPTLKMEKHLIDRRVSRWPPRA